ncbi:MAG: TetR/AcrR family transcriptional regulator [Caulobacteraceae bacterium]
MTVEIETAAAKAPKTSRGERTRQRILEAAEAEFGERGFHEAAVSGITQRAGVALGSFYTYFNSKEELYRALVEHMGEITRRWLAERTGGAPDRLSAERQGIEAFIEFVRAHRSLYRIVMESQFVAPDAYRAYYDGFADAYRRGLHSAALNGEIADGPAEERAWALIGMSVFLGLRYGVWDAERPASEVAGAVAGLLEHGLAPKPKVS